MWHDGHFDSTLISSILSMVLAIYMTTCACLCHCIYALDTYVPLICIYFGRRHIFFAGIRKFRNKHLTPICYNFQTCALSEIRFYLWINVYNAIRQPRSRNPLYLMGCNFIYQQTIQLRWNIIQLMHIKDHYLTTYQNYPERCIINTT